MQGNMFQCSILGSKSLYIRLYLDPLIHLPLKLSHILLFHLHLCVCSLLSIGRGHEMYVMLHVWPDPDEKVGYGKLHLLATREGNYGTFVEVILPAWKDER